MGALHWGGVGGCLPNLDHLYRPNQSNIGNRHPLGISYAPILWQYVPPGGPCEIFTLSSFENCVFASCFISYAFKRFSMVNPCKRCSLWTIYFALITAQWPWQFTLASTRWIQVHKLWSQVIDFLTKACLRRWKHNRRHWILNGKFAVSRSWTQLPTVSPEREISKLSCQDIYLQTGLGKGHGW